MRAGQRRMVVCPAVPLRGRKTVRLDLGPKRVRAVLARVLRLAPRWRAGWDRRRGGRGGRGRNRWRWRFQWSWRHGRHGRCGWDRRLVRKRGDRPVRGRPGMLRPAGELLQFRRAATPVVPTRGRLPRGSRVRHVLPFLHVSHDRSDQRRAPRDLRYLRERRRLRSAPSLPREPHVRGVRGEDLRGSLTRPGRAGRRCRGCRPYAPVGRYPCPRTSRIQTGEVLPARFLCRSVKDFVGTGPNTSR